MIPKTPEGRAKVMRQRKSSFIEIPKERYSAYRQTAIEDLNSAEQDVRKPETIRWAIVKAYNAFTMLCAALLVKYQGRYVKDADGLFAAIREGDLISEERWQILQNTLNTSATFEEFVEEVRLLRNKALYYPRTQTKLTDRDAISLIEKIRQMILIIGEGL